MGWIELDIPVSQAGLGFKQDILGRQDPLARRSSRIIAFDDHFVHVFFGDQFEDGLEEVGV